MLEPLAIGNWILNAEVSDDSTTMRDERENRREDGARDKQAEGERAEHDDADDVPACAGRQIPEQG